MSEAWEVLSAYKHCRLRTEIFFGSRDPHTQAVLEHTTSGPQIVETTWVPAVFTAFRELLDNALDEVILHGHGDRIDVTYDAAEMTLSITDNGRGIPIEWSEEHQKHAATVLLSEMNSGRNFAVDRGEARGLNGIGAKGVNFCSTWFDVEVYRGKKRFTQQFYEGDELQVGLATVAATTSKKTGTKIRCKLSTKVFPDMRLPERFIASRMQEIVICYPKLHLTYNGQRVQPRPLFVEQNPITFMIDEPNFKAKFWLVPNFVADGDFSFSLVNAIPLFNGGSHIDAFKRGFYSGLLGSLERESKKRKLLPNRADVGDGLLLYSVLEMTAPTFDSPPKSRLINEHVGTRVRKMLDEPEFFKDIIKKNPLWIDSIYLRCAKRTKERDDKDTKKQAKKNLRQKIEDLEDACGLDRSKCILFLTEGKSAVAGITEARDSSVHGSLPLRGKILNTHGQSHRIILENDALKKVMNSIGLIPGQRVNRHALRYGKVFLACDADPDGNSIAALLTCFFYTCWPELFDAEREPFLFIFNTPLIIASKGKQRKYWYTDDYDNFKPDKMLGWEITRAKGLAALTKEDWKYVLENPHVQPMKDDGKLAGALDLIFNASRADDRKKWLSL